MFIKHEATSKSPILPSYMNHSFSHIERKIAESVHFTTLFTRMNSYIKSKKLCFLVAYY